MAAKTDIQATRSDAAAGASAIIAAPIRLRGIIIASDGTGAAIIADAPAAALDLVACISVFAAIYTPSLWLLEEPHINY